MLVLTSQQMREADRIAIEQIGIPGLVLMENAARGCFEVIHALFEGDVEGATLLVICGKGNNGADGLAVARHARLHGMIPTCILLHEESELGADASRQLAILRAFDDVEIVVMKEWDDDAVVADYNLIVDAMLGTGASGELRSPYRDAVEWANAQPIFRVAVDIPTGVGSDTGEVASTAFAADATVTMAALKPGLLLGDGADYAGEIFVANIGTPNHLYESGTCALLDADEALPGLPEVRSSRHKYDRGKGLVLAGSRGMAGAGAMTSAAAISAGAGLVVYGMPETILESTLPLLRPEIMSLPLPASDGAFASDAYAALEEQLDRYTIIAIGPGFSRSPHALDFVRDVVRRSPVPVVLDADGLNAFAGAIDLLRERESPLVITPHHGEMARLLGVDSDHVGRNALETARTAAERIGAIVVLKGAPTIVAAPDGRTWINSAGNAGMATAGTGDVLTGTIAGLCAGRDREDFLPGVLTAVWLHSRAGDLAVRDGSIHALRATDLIDYLPEAFRELDDE